MIDCSAIVASAASLQFLSGMMAVYQNIGDQQSQTLVHSRMVDRIREIAAELGFDMVPRNPVPLEYIRSGNVVPIQPRDASIIDIPEGMK